MTTAKKVLIVLKEKAGKDFSCLHITRESINDVEVPLNIIEKGGVNPVTFSYPSDDLFLEIIEKDLKFDVIFVDGYHTAEQVEKDILNAWQCLNKGGKIVLENINPPTEEHQIVPRQQISWTGDCWKAWAGFKKVNKNVKCEHINSKYGIGVINFKKVKLKPDFIAIELTYADLEADRTIITK